MPDAIIDSNFDKDPVSFKYGDGNLLSSFENIMLGLKPEIRNHLRVS